jgi:hypothetical protein
LDAFAREGFAGGFAVDLAAGEGRDTLELLNQGRRVLVPHRRRDSPRRRRRAHHSIGRESDQGKTVRSYSASVLPDMVPTE